jgi:alpha-mannosidase
VKAIEPYNGYVPLSLVGGAAAPAVPGSTIEFFVEAASNPDVGGASFHLETPMGDEATAGDAPIYTLRTLDLAERDTVVWELDRDIWTLLGLMRTLDPGTPRRHEILRALERMCDVVDHDDVAGSAALVREALAGVLASPAAAPTASSPPGTRTSTRRGSGPSARRSARWRAPSRTSSP